MADYEGLFKRLGTKVVIPIYKSNLTPGELQYLPVSDSDSTAWGFPRSVEKIREVKEEFIVELAGFGFHVFNGLDKENTDGVMLYTDFESVGPYDRVNSQRLSRLGKVEELRTTAKEFDLKWQDFS